MSSASDTAAAPPATRRVAVVDDEPGICRALARFLGGRGVEVTSYPRAEEFLDSLEGDGPPPDLVFMDVRLPGLSGLDAVERMARRAGAPPVVVMTAHGTLDVAVEALRRGALDYLSKPLDLEGVAAALERALAGAAPGLATEPPPTGAEDSPVGRSGAMQGVFRRIAAVSLSEVPVLITGESGTGKELVARSIHRASRRGKGPFEALDCASLPESLLESELFGHERGAFTGAVQRRTGRLERAHGGTLFLDEVGEIPLASQTRLLRFLETRTFERLGGEGTVTVDTRVLAATHRDLRARIAEGHFREDLFYRLHVIPIHVPPLRDRPDDIPLLVARFLGREGPASRLAPETLDALVAHTWPGNVRELRNAVDHARVLARGGVLLPSHLPPAVRGEASSAGRSDPDDATLRALVARRAAADDGSGNLHARVMGDLERHLLEEVLRRCEGNQAQAARILGIHRTTLKERLNRSIQSP